MGQYNRFEFSLRPRILYGVGCRSEVSDQLKTLGAKKILICTDEGVRKAGVLDMIAGPLKESSLDLVGVYDGFIQDARTEQINAAAKMIRETGADGVIALGGGSVMDSVKAIVHMMGHGQDDFRNVLSSPAPAYKPLMPHIAFPTTSGTGCELTPAAVILDEEKKEKIIFIDFFCNPDVAMLDPELVVGLPPKITVFTGMDALTHAIEGYTGLRIQPMGEATALRAIKGIVEWLPKALENGSDLEARGEMMLAACMVVIGSGGLGAVHATAHALGGRFGIPHGLANTIMLPWVMEANLESCLKKYRDIAQAMGVPVDHVSEEEGAILAIKKVRALAKELGIHETLADCGLSEEKIDETGLVDLAMSDMMMLSNPRQLSHDEVRDLYIKAL